MKKIKLLSIIPTIITVISSFSSFLINKNTLTCQLHKFCGAIYDNQTLVGGEYQYNYFSIKYKNVENKTSYLDLFNNYYYNLSIGESRCLLSNSFVDEQNNKLKLYTQNSFSISNGLLPDGGHYLDYGIFSTYYADDILGPRKYLDIRNNCDSFIFISDTYADKLLEKYNISSYEELINDDKYSVLEMMVDNDKTCKFSINNILYSDKRHGLRAKNLYGDFAVAYNYSGINKWSEVNFEIDLKANIYSNSNLFKDFHAQGYSIDKFDYNFFKYDSATSSYFLSNELNKKFISLDFNKNDSFLRMFDVLCCLLNLTLLIGFYFLLDVKFDLNWSFYFYLLCFLIYGLIVNFVSIYFLTSIIPILSLLLIGFFSRKEVANDFRTIFCKMFKTKNSKSMEKFYKIEI